MTMLTHKMGGISVLTSTNAVIFADGTEQNTAAVPATDTYGNTYVADNTGVTITDTNGNQMAMGSGFVSLSADDSGGGVSMWFDGTVYGASLSDGQGNALLLGDGFGNFNLSNESAQAGLISTTGNTCFCYGNPLFVGVSGGNGITIDTTGAAVNCPFSIASEAPASSSAAGNVGQIAWASGYIYVCVAANTWQRAALATW